MEKFITKLELLRAADSADLLCEIGEPENGRDAYILMASDEYANRTQVSLYVYEDSCMVMIPWEAEYVGNMVQRLMEALGMSPYGRIEMHASCIEIEYDSRRA